MLKAIVCVDNRMNIGRGNDLLFHIKADMKRFKELTIGHTVIMGYKTWESLPKKPLKDRKNIVLTKKDIKLEGATVYHNTNTILGNYMSSDDIGWIIGGESIYSQFLPYCDEVYLTQVYQSVEDADKKFRWSEWDWNQKEYIPYEQDEDTKLWYCFITYTRRKTNEA